MDGRVWECMYVFIPLGRYLGATARALGPAGWLPSTSCAGTAPFGVVGSDSQSSTTRPEGESTGGHSDG